MLELNKSNFVKETEKGVVVVDFSASWCGPCKMMIPIFEEVSKEMKDVKFTKVDVDDNPDIAQKFGVMGIPTFIVFKNGKEVDRSTGAVPKSSLKAKLEAASKK